MLRVQFIANRIRRFLTDETGQMLLLFALLLPVLFGFTAIAIDIGILRYQKEQLQTAADAAAISGALEISYCGGSGASGCPAMQTAAKPALVENGYTNVTLRTQCSGSASAPGITLMLNNGPCMLDSKAKDPSYGNKSAVEVVVSKEEPTYFARILGIDHFRVSARSEASQGNSPYCIYISTYPPGGTPNDTPQAILVNSGGHLTAACGLMDDSSSNTALLANSGAHVDTSRISIVGGDLLNGGGNSVHISPSPVTNAPGLPDRLR